jgi:hypothetical protein
MPNNKWMVSELVDCDGIPRFIIAHRQSETPWLRVWQHRANLQSKLAAFFRTLSDAKLEPVARPLLGSAIAIDEKTAHAVCRFRVAEIARMAGCSPGELPDFLCNESANKGGRGHSRPCAVLSADGVKEFASITDAARYFGVAQPTFVRRVRQTRQGVDGAVTIARGIA